ncbi:MAG: competence/damage-inducible protein A, partial [Alphaproteobacteria bacterium]
AIAAVFGRKIDVRPDALALLEAHYAARNTEMNDGRRRMARVPDGAELILNPVSAAPGFRIDNVFVMAGVPAVMRGMLQDIGHRIEGGERVHASTIRGKGLKEGDIAAALGEIARAAPDVNIGSYPFMKPGWRGPEFGVNLVARGRDPDQVAVVVAALAELVTQQGAKPEVDPKD